MAPHALAPLKWRSSGTGGMTRKPNECTDSSARSSTTDVAVERHRQSFTQRISDTTSPKLYTHTRPQKPMANCMSLN